MAHRIEEFKSAYIESRFLSFAQEVVGSRNESICMVCKFACFIPSNVQIIVFVLGDSQWDFCSKCRSASTSTSGKNIKDVIRRQNPFILPNFSLFSDLISPSLDKVYYKYESYSVLRTLDLPNGKKRNICWGRGTMQGGGGNSFWHHHSKGASIWSLTRGGFLKHFYPKELYFTE